MKLLEGLVGWSPSDVWRLNRNPLFLQRIRATVNSQEQKRLLMDLDINMRTVDCFYTVTFYGALFREVRPWWEGGRWVPGYTAPPPPLFCTPAPLRLACGPLLLMLGPQQTLAERPRVPGARHKSEMVHTGS